METQLITYKEAILHALGDKKLRRAAWNECRHIRKFCEADADMLSLQNASDDFIVEDCKERVCDCSVGPYRPTSEDKEANDWIIIA